MTSPADRDRRPAPTTLTARSPEDLLAAVPVLLGFHPEESVVMLTLGGAQQFHARVDLPRSPARRPDADLAVRRGLDELAGMLLDPVRRHRVGSVAFVVYTADARLGDRAGRVLLRRFREAGVTVLPVLRTDGRRWWSCPTGRHGVPAHGVPYDVAGHPFAAQAVLDGRVTHDSRAALAATVAPVPALVAEVAAVAPAAPAGDGPVRDLDDAVVRTVAVLAEHLPAGTVPGAAAAATLLADLRDDRVRDVVWTAVRRHDAREHVRFWTALVQRAPDPLVAAPAALLGWSAWLAGDGALAWCAVDRCREAEPDHPLAGLVAEVLTRAVPPSALDEVWDDPDGDPLGPGCGDGVGWL